VDELIELTNTWCHEGGKLHCNIAEECGADHYKQLPGHTCS